MLNRSKAILKRPHTNSNAYFSENTSCFLKNLYARDLGLMPSRSFIINSNTNSLKDINLSKSRSIQSLAHSITWLSLDNVDSRLFVNLIEIFRSDEQGTKNTDLKLLFNSAKKKNTHSHCVSCIQWYPIDSGMFFTSGMDQRFKVWDTNNLQVVDEYYLKQKIYSHHISTLMSNNTKTLIALALDNGQVRFIDLNTGSFTHTLKAHSQGYCVCVQWSPYDSNIIASAGSDGRILLWDIRSSKSCLKCFDYEKTVNSKQKHTSVSAITSKAVAHCGPIIGLAYTSDGNHVVSLGKDNALRLWDASSGLNTLVNYGKVPLNSAVAESCMQISCTDMCSPNYVFVPSGSNLLMYNILEGDLNRTFKAHFDSLNCCIYNQALKEIYTGSKDRNILIWRTDRDVSETETSTSLCQQNSTYSLMSSTGRGNTDTPGTSEGRDNWSDDED